MQDMNRKFHKLINESNKKLRYRVLSALMALAVVISVYASLIMPAISAGSSEEVPMLTAAQNSSGVGSRPANENGYFDSAITETPEGATDFSDKVTSATLTFIDLGRVVEVPDNAVTITADGDKLNVKFVLNYTISRVDGGAYTVTKENPCIYYQLPEGIEVPNEYYGSSRTVIDDNYSKQVAGYYSISEDGLVVIQFTDDYIDTMLADSESFTGALSFDGTISRADTASGDQTINIGGTKITINFPDMSLGVDKAGTVESAESADGNAKIKWTVTVKNYYTAEYDLTGYVLSDGKFPANGEGVTVEPSGLGSFGDDGSFTFTGNAETVTFTYYTDVTDINGKYESGVLSESNTATLSKGDDTYTDTETVTLQKTTLDKFGSPDYNTGAADNKINWTVTVENPYGTSLGGYKIHDDAFKDGTVSITAADENGNPVTLGAADADGNITITGDIKKLVLTYSTDATPDEGSESKTVSNTAKIIYPNGSEGNSSSQNVTYENQYTLGNKTGTYDYDTGEITWTVSASTKSEANKKTTLDGYTITDPALANVDLADINITSAKFNWGNYQVIEQSSSEIVIGIIETDWQGNITSTTPYATITKAGDTLTITDTNPYDSETMTNDDVVRGLHGITFTYTTKKSDADTSGTNGTTSSTNSDGDTVISNEVSDNKGHESTGTVTIADRDSISKTLVGDSGEVKYIDTDTETSPITGTKVLDWEINAVSDTGFSGESKVLVDVMNASTSDGTAEHYIDLASQQSEIKVYAKEKESGEYTEISSDLYTLNFSPETAETDGKATGFSIVFKEGVDTANYHFVKIAYKTTAEYSLNMPSGDDSTSAVFSNTATFDENTSNTPTYTIELKDKNYVAPTSISVVKKWSDSSGSDVTAGADSITFKLQRKLGTSGTWETIYKNESDKWVVDDTDTETFTLSSSDSWTTLFDDLPSENTAHTEKYYYRAVEASATDGFTVSYSDENGIQSGTFTITNTKNVTVSKTALDKNKKDANTIQLSGLDKTTVSEVEYYAVPWRITVGKHSQSLKITDTLPAGTILLENYDRGDRDYWNNTLTYPAYYSSNGSYWSMNNSSERFTVNSDGTVDFYVPSGDECQIVYYIGVPVDSVDSGVAEGFELTNSVSGEGTTSDTADVTIIDTEVPTESSLLTKNVENLSDGSNYNAINGRISYSVYVNPNGKNLSNTDEYDLTDSLMIDKYDWDTDVLGLIDAKLFEVVVEEVGDVVTDADGKVTSATVVKKLNSSEYKYTVEYKPQETETISIDTSSFAFEYALNSSWDYLKISGLYSISSGGIVKLKFTGDANSTATFTIGYESVTLQFDENGEALYDWNVSGFGYVSENIQITSGSLTDVQVVSASYEKVTTLSTADLHLTVPDERPLKITYRYDLTKSGAALEADKALVASNKISLDTGNAKSEDSKDGTSFVISKSDAVVSTGEYPQIVKTDVNDYSVALDASFYIAQFDGTTKKWVFATAIEEVTNSDTKETTHEITYGLEADGDKIPADTETLTKAIISTGGTPYKISLDTGTLYKIIEIKAPEGYEGDDSMISGGYETLADLLTAYMNDPSGFEGTAYYSFLDNYVSTHYFTFGSEDVTYPDGFNKSDAINVTTGGSIDITDNKLIDLTTIKSWDSDVAAKSSIKAELYWSYTKSSSGIPSGAKKAAAEDLGMTELQNPKTIVTSGEPLEGEAGPTPPSYTWQNLPSGKNDKPIYYYVKEIEYTVGGVTYKLQDDGTYMSDEGETGEFKPSYVGNAANSDGTIKINNSKGLTIKKVWKNSDNTDMTSYPVDEISVKLYGTDSDSKESELGSYTLKKSENWSLTIPDDVDLSPYTSFRVEEQTTLSGYQISYTSNLNGTTGTLTITNKSSDTAYLSIEKTWVSQANAAIDGNSDKLPTDITLELYRMSSADTPPENVDEVPDLTSAELVDTLTLTKADGWKLTLNDLDKQDADGNAYVYYVKEVDSGYTAAYTSNGHQLDGSTIKVTNTVTLIDTISLNLQKTWSDDDHNTADTVEVELHRTTNLAEVPSDVKIILPALTLDKETVTVSEGGTVQVTANNKLTTFTSGNGAVASVQSVDDNTIKITGVSAGDTYIEVSDGQTTKRINVSVTEKPYLQLSPSESSITAGETVQLSASMSDSSTVPELTYTSSNESAATVNSSGLVTGVGSGEATITAKNSDGSLQATAKVTVALSDTFTLTGSSEVAAGSTIQLMPSPIYGTFTYSSDNTAAATVDNSGLVTGVAKGTATITATRNDGVSDTFDVTVKAASVDDSDTGSISLSSDSKTITLDSPRYVSNITINITSTEWSSIQIQVDDWKASCSAYWWDLTDSLAFNDVTIGGNQFTFEINQEIQTITFIAYSSNPTFDYTINYGEAVSASYSLRTASLFAARSAVTPQIIDASLDEYGFDANGVMKTNITLKASDGTNWQATVNNLPACDSEGNTYYYWVKEVAVNGNPVSDTTYDTRYLYEDGNGSTEYCIDAANPGDGNITIHNTVPSGSLPETGGIGRWPYYLAGGAIMLCGAAYYLIDKRRLMKCREK